MSENKKTINVAVISAGSRGSGVTNNLLRDSDRNVKILSVFDPDKKQCEKAIELWNSPGTAICETYQEAINTPGVEWVLVFSPNAYHKEHILAGFAAGKNVFSEKPLATRIEDCQEIFEAHQKSSLIFATGFVLRYSKLYRKAKELISSGKLGKVLSIDANENITPAHGGYIMMNWRRLTKFAGPISLKNAVTTWTSSTGSATACRQKSHPSADLIISSRKISITWISMKKGFLIHGPIRTLNLLLSPRIRT